MDLQSNICQGGILEELAIPLGDVMEWVSLVLSPAAVSAKQGVTKATVGGPPHPPSLRSGGWGGGRYQQVL